MAKKLKRVRATPLVRKMDSRCVAHVYRVDGSKFAAEFPLLIINKMPDVPHIIRVEKDYFVCTSTNPLTYHQSICCRAEGRDAER